jgi:hypothetical protein
MGSLDAGKTAEIILAKETPHTDKGCTNGGCIEGIVVQQSCPWCPCEEHGMELQHCIACSGVVMASQSKAYTPSRTRTPRMKIGFAKRISSNLSVLVL